MTAEESRGRGPAEQSRRDAPRPERPPMEDPVENASTESFPASDPPSWTPLHIGEPRQHPDDAG